MEPGPPGCVPGNFYLIIYLFCTSSDAAGEPSPAGNLLLIWIILNKSILLLFLSLPVYREARFFISF